MTLQDAVDRVSKVLGRRLRAKGKRTAAEPMASPATPWRSHTATLEPRRFANDLSKQDVDVLVRDLCRQCLAAQSRYFVRPALPGGIASAKVSSAAVGSVPVMGAQVYDVQRNVVLTRFEVIGEDRR